MKSNSKVTKRKDKNAEKQNKNEKKEKVTSNVDSTSKSQPS